MLEKNDVKGESSKNTVFADKAARKFPSSRLALQLVLMAGILTLALAITASLIITRPQPEGRPPFRSVYTVKMITAKRDIHQPVFSSYGEIKAAQSADLRSLVAGTIIWTSPKLKSGGDVEKDEALIKIDKFNYDGALREAKANETEALAKLAEAQANIKLEKTRQASAKEQLKLAQADYSRTQQLRRRGAASQKMLDDKSLILSQRRQSLDQSEINIVASLARIKQLNANLDRLKWRIEKTERDLDNTTLKAPFSGTIRSSSAAVGKLVSVNDIVVSMYQSDQLEARFVVTDEQFSRIRTDLTDRPATIIWTAGGIEHEFAAKIDRIGAEVTSARGGIELFALLTRAEQNQTLRPGAFVEIRVADKIYENHFKIPDTAIYNRNKVYAVVEGVLEEREVVLSGYDGEFGLIASGINEGEEILVTRISEISAGLKVRKQGEAGSGQKFEGRHGKAGVGEGKKEQRKRPQS